MILPATIISDKARVAAGKDWSYFAYNFSCRTSQRIWSRVSLARRSSECVVSHRATPDRTDVVSWNQYYQNDLEVSAEHDENHDITQLESWFDDVNAPVKVLEYLTSATFPLSPNNPRRVTDTPSILDLGTGNGSTLFELKLEGGYRGRMLGVDYSQPSVDLARRLWRRHVEQTAIDQDGTPLTDDDVHFARLDILRDDPQQITGWPSAGFELVLDKGTFDAISLSAETIPGASTRVCQAYPGKVAGMIAPGGFLMVTSCNWTEEEVTEWFTRGDGVESVLEVYGKVQYPSFTFGGSTGQGVASICFRKRASAC